MENRQSRQITYHEHTYRYGCTHSYVKNKVHIITHFICFYSVPILFFLLMSTFSWTHCWKKYSVNWTIPHWPKTLPERWCYFSGLWLHYWCCWSIHSGKGHWCWSAERIDKQWWCCWCCLCCLLEQHFQAHVGFLFKVKFREKIEAERRLLKIYHHSLACA